MNNEPHWDHLIQGHLDDTLTESDHAEFDALMLQSASARRRFWDLAEIHGLARDATRIAWGHADASAEQEAALPKSPNRPAANWWTRVLTRPLMPLAAGIAIGVLCTSVAWAYVAPSLGKVLTLLQESFESGPAPLVTGVPIEAGRWSGDYSELVGERQGVKPETGKRMLRFLRGDYEGKSIPSSHSSDVFRIVDVRQFKREFADGGAVVQLSAVFNAAPFPADENFSATLTLFALDANLVGNEVVRGENVLSTESLAFARSSRVGMDRDPATWQKVSNELRLPPSTEFLMLRIGMSNDTKSKDKRRDSFTGHFADKVQLVIARRAEIPVP